MLMTLRSQLSVILISSVPHTDHVLIIIYIHEKRTVAVSSYWNYCTIPIVVAVIMKKELSRVAKVKSWGLPWKVFLRKRNREESVGRRFLAQ